MDMMTVVARLIGELVREMPELIDAIIDRDQTAEARIEQWLRTSDNNKVAEARWWASRLKQPDGEPGGTA